MAHPKGLPVLQPGPVVESWQPSMSVGKYVGVIFPNVDYFASNMCEEAYQVS